MSVGKEELHEAIELAKKQTTINPVHNFQISGGSFLPTGILDTPENRQEIKTLIEDLKVFSLHSTVNTVVNSQIVNVSFDAFIAFERDDSNYAGTNIEIQWNRETVQFPAYFKIELRNRLVDVETFHYLSGKI